MATAYHFSVSGNSHLHREHTYSCSWNTCCNQYMCFLLFHIKGILPVTASTVQKSTGCFCKIINLCNLQNNSRKPNSYRQGTNCIPSKQLLSIITLFSNIGVLCVLYEPGQDTPTTVRIAPSYWSKYKN
jgi:hypothetical protein